MRIILSRKGFDARNGGVPSPIFPSDELHSLPIQEPEPSRLRHPIRYGHIAAHHRSLGDIVQDLTGGRVRQEDAAHLDPDLDALSLPRQPHWRPIFGQADAAESHLQHQGVDKGDVFLFFGWFRRVEQVAGSYRYVSGKPDLHVIFGWLQVERRIPLRARSELPKWALYHPHCQVVSPSTPDSLYISTPQMCLPGAHIDVPGGGVFRRFAPALCLTAEGCTRSIWRMPGWCYPREGVGPLSYHRDPRRWTKNGATVLLRSAGRGQEFVLDCDRHPEAISWLTGLLCPPGMHD